MSVMVDLTLLQQAVIVAVLLGWVDLGEPHPLRSEGGQQRGDALGALGERPLVGDHCEPAVGQDDYARFHKILL
jgi:hypothetical protein